MKNKKTPGQAVVIITLFIAIMIVFTIALINIAKVSDIKTSTSQIADQGALSLSSELGSYVNALQKKIDQRSQLIANCAPNWGIILISLAIIAGILFPPGGLAIAAMIVLVGSGVAVQMMEIRGIEARAFGDAAYSMTSYTAFRENSIHTMLTSFATDDAIVNWTGNGQFTDESANPKVVYNLVNATSGKPIEGYATLCETHKQNKPVYRYDAWYWAKRFPQISESGRLTPYIDQFITAINNNTKIEEWDPDKWEIHKLSLKVSNIAQITSLQKRWVIDGSTVRIVGPVQLNDWLISGLPLWLRDFFYMNEEGFLLALSGFRGLTNRILDTICFDVVCNPASPAITYSRKVGANYEHNEITQVADDIYGFLTRSMELLNLPVSYRVLAINNWLPLFYNEEVVHNPGARVAGDLFGRLQWDLAKVQGWRAQLTSIATTIRPIILAPNGDCANGLGNPVNHCMPNLCCNDTTCWCCDDTICTWQGTMCTCNPELFDEGLLGHGDLYGYKPAQYTNSFHCECACGSGVTPSEQSIRSCRFQGSYHWYNFSGKTEIEQTIEILQKLEITLSDIITAISNLATEVRNMQNLSPAERALKNEAVYGWIDKHNNHRVVRVKIDDYLEYDDFPKIKENDQAIYTLFKCWEINGTVSGNIKTTASSYVSDVPAGWWNFKFRKNPGVAEFNQTTLKQVIDQVQSTGNVTSFSSPVLTNLLSNYSITSTASGHWGRTKEEIFIKRDQ